MTSKPPPDAPGQLAEHGTSLSLQLHRVLRCPRCRSGFGFASPTSLRCGEGHVYPVIRGVPRLVKQAWGSGEAELVAATRHAFGTQWTELGDDAGVSRSDLMLHLPARWGPEVFSGLVLDAGCGMGRYTALAAELGATAIGLDLSEAVGKAAQLYPQVAFVQGDLMAAPLAPASFDLVYSFGVLHHLSDPGRGFQAAFGLVKPGGALLAWVYSDHGGVLRQGRRRARRLAARFPRARKPMAWLAAASLWSAFVVPPRLLGREPRRLHFHRDKGLRQLYVDCHDALAAPLERYLSRRDCEECLDRLDARESAFERRRDGSGWVVWAKK